VLAAPGSNNYSGLIASSTSNKGRSDACEFQGLSEKEANDLCLQFDRLVCKIAHDTEESVSSSMNSRLRAYWVLSPRRES